jgi:hypothetical protein
MVNKMKKLALIAALAAAPALAEPVQITHENYTFDFATIGYEVEMTGTIYNISEPLENGDYVWLHDSGYRIKVSFDALSRKGKRDLTEYFNNNCIGWDNECFSSIAGEVQLDEDMRVTLLARSAVVEEIDYK